MKRRAKRICWRCRACVFVDKVHKPACTIRDDERCIGAAR